MKTVKTLFVCLITSFALYAQVEVELTIENTAISGKDFFFDIFLKTTPASTGDLYLGNADLILTFDETAFGSPSLSKTPLPSPGANSFEPTDPSPVNVATTQELYFNNTAVSISDGELRINLNGPTPADMVAFNSNVAKIEGTASLHRLGSFHVSDMTNPNSNAGLAWKATGGGLVTKVYGMTVTDPFVSSQSGLIPAAPANDCTIAPVQMTVTSASPNVLVLQADETLKTEGGVNVVDGDTKTYKAGQSIQLNTGFEVELGAEFDAVIEECNTVGGKGVKEK